LQLWSLSRCIVAHRLTLTDVAWLFTSNITRLLCPHVAHRLTLTDVASLFPPDIMRLLCAHVANCLLWSGLPAWHVLVVSGTLCLGGCPGSIQIQLGESGILVRSQILLTEHPPTAAISRAQCQIVGSECSGWDSLCGRRGGIMSCRDTRGRSGTICVSGMICVS